MLKVITDLIPLGHPNRPGIKLEARKARVWHGTANLAASAGDEMHRKYAGRAFTKKWNAVKEKYEYFEADGSKFRFGAAHVYIDKDSATIMVPLDEYVPGCGDRPGDYSKYKGQTKLAQDVFGHRQNYQTIQIELCMNDMVNFDKVLANAIEFCTMYIPDIDMEDYRHFDITGKGCPSPLMDATKWHNFVTQLDNALHAKKIPEGTPLIRINGEIINRKMDVQPVIIDNRIFAPVRYVAEAFGKTVTYITTEKIVDIK